MLHMEPVKGCKGYLLMTHLGGIKVFLLLCQWFLRSNHVDSQEVGSIAGLLGAERAAAGRGVSERYRIFVCLSLFISASKG